MSVDVNELRKCVEILWAIQTGLAGSVTLDEATSLYDQLGVEVPKVSKAADELEALRAEVERLRGLNDTLCEGLGNYTIYELIEILKKHRDPWRPISEPPEEGADVLLLGTSRTNGELFILRVESFHPGTIDSYVTHWQPARLEGL